MGQTVIILLQLLTLFVGFMNTYNTSNTHRLVEGDMILNQEQLTYIYSNDTYRNAHTMLRKWPNNVLIYDYEDGYPSKMKEMIEKAIKDFENHSCVRMRRKTASDCCYSLITNGAGCYSHVGYRVPGEDAMVMYLHEVNCASHGHILHEFLHALGFVHMHTDPSRDAYVIIHEENIDEKGNLTKMLEDNFNKYGDVVSSFGVPYDYGSVMHYGEKEFSKNGKITMETINPKNAPIGQRDGFSESDIKKLNLFYEC